MAFALARLAALDAVANAQGLPLTPERLNALAWAECLLRADCPSLKRVAACCAEIRTQFGLIEG